MMAGQTVGMVAPSGSSRQDEVHNCAWHGGSCCQRDAMGGDSRDSTWLV